MRRLALAIVLVFGLAASDREMRLSADDYQQSCGCGNHGWDDGSMSDALPGGGRACHHCSSHPSHGSRWFAGQEYLFLRTHFSEALAFARVNDSMPGGVFTRRVRSEELDFDYESSFRSTLGYHLNDTSDLRFTYWHLDVDTLVTGVAGVGETIVDPYGGLAPTGSDIAASAAVKMNVYDLEYVRPLHFTRPNLGFEYSAGLRIADVEQSSVSTIRNAGVLTSEGAFSADFFGVGPYMAMTGNVSSRRFDRLSLFGKMGTALLVGQYDVGSQFMIPGTVNGGQQAERTRMVPVIEMEVGSEWKATDYLTISSGWLFQSWFNLGASGGTFDPNAGAFAGGSFDESAFVGTDDADIMSFDGLFVRAELEF